MKTKSNAFLAGLVLLFAMFVTFTSVYGGKCPYGPVSFTNSYVDSGFLFYNSGNIGMPVKIDFGDGQSFYGVRPQNGIFHHYNQNGQYKATVYYNDTFQNCRDTAVQELCYFKLKDSIVFLKSHDTLFTAAPCYPNAFYRWWYGDNAYGKNCNSWHVYSNRGYYMPQLVFVIDTPSSCYYFYNPKQVQMDFTKCGFVADFYNDRYLGQFPLRQKAIVNTYPFLDPKKKQNGRETWYWGDGTSTTKTSIQNHKDTHYYAVKGLYNICHVYEDSLQCKDSVCAPVEVDSCDAYAQFTYTMKDRVATFNFKASFNYTWLVNGQVVSLNNKQYTFGTNGSYTVCLRAPGIDNCKAEVCSTLLAIKCEPLERNNISWTIKDDDCSVFNFKNSNNHHTDFRWDFGDNSGSADKEPTHTYGKDSLYKVKLIASDSVYHCKDSLMFNVFKYCCYIKDSVVIKKLSRTFARIENYSYIRHPRGPVHKHKWIIEGTTVYNNPTPTHAFFTPGLKKIIYIAYDTVNNCHDSLKLDLVIDSADQVPFQVNFTLNSGLSNQLLNQNIFMFPNPIGEVLWISGGQLENLLSVSIINLNGQEIELNWREENGLYRISLPSELASGVYVIRLRSKQGTITAKLIKE